MNLVTTLEQQYRKTALPPVQTGDTVRVHQLIKEGNKQRIQVFEGVVIRRHRMGELTAVITVRRIASGVGVEKTFLLHSPNVSKVQIMRRAKVRRNFLSFLRDRRGKSARLQEIGFDKAAANAVNDAPAADAAPQDAAPQDSPVDEPASADTTDTADQTIDAQPSEDALNDAVPLTQVENAEAKAAAAQDEPTSAQVDPDAANDQTAAAEEVQQGLDRAEAGEGDAVKS